MEVGLKELVVMFVGTGLVGVCGALLRVWQRMAVMESEMGRTEREQIEHRARTHEEEREYRARAEAQINEMEGRFDRRLSKFQEESASELARVARSVDAMREEIHEIKIMISEIKFKEGSHGTE